MAVHGHLINAKSFFKSLYLNIGKNVFKRKKKSCLRFGLNTYMYAPKDDDKHRSRWRDLYNEQQANQLKELIDLTKQNGIKFIYALSPGLDIRYSDENHFNALKNKFDQVFVCCLFVT